jgi:hypothetical protein
MTQTLQAGDVGAGEVLTLEQQCLPAGAREGVGKEIAVVQACSVPPASESPPRAPRFGHVIEVDGNHFNSGLLEKEIEFARGALTKSALNHD